MSLWLHLVVFGCLGFLGVVFSTIPAQLRKPIPPLMAALPTSAGSQSRGKRHAGSQKKSDGIAASYARYSSDLQREASIPDQQRKCRERASANGHQILPQFEFSDQAISGTTVDRLGLNKLLEGARSGTFQILYFESLSRLARESVISMPMLKDLVHNCGIRIISVTEGIDSDCDSWEVLATIFSLQHEQYLKYLSHSVLRGLEGALQAGYSIGDWCFGYKSVPEPGSESGRRGRNAKPRMVYQIDEETSAWVVRIFEWYVTERRSLRWIARELTRRKAPKDHRATTSDWHQDYVRRILRNTKYIGIWPWGKSRNHRNPLTGQVTQKDRPSEECDPWTRQFPELRLINDEVFHRAQKILQDNKDRHATVRRRDGRLRGSQGNGTQAPRHLLGGLIFCEICGGPFTAGGGGQGNYLVCRGYFKGRCHVKTHLPRKRAERLILEAISKRILDNPTWRRAVLNETLTAWHTLEETAPSEMQALEKALEEIQRKIDRLLDLQESGADEPDLRERLVKRRQHKTELQSQLAALQVRPHDSTPPTEDWVMTQVGELHKILKGSGPASAYALRDLVGNRICVREIQVPGKQRAYLQGRFAPTLGRTVALLQGNSSSNTVSMAEQHCLDEVVLDFRELPHRERLADPVKELFDSGLTFPAIAARLGCSVSMTHKAFAAWHHTRGISTPNASHCRKRLAKRGLTVELSDAAKQLADQGLLLCEIAQRLGCCPNTLTQALQHWYRSRGLVPPDGRLRRKGLPVKNRGGP